MRTQRGADILAGCLVALVGAVILYASTDITAPGGHRLSPRTFPFVVGGLLILCGLGLSVKSWSLQDDHRIQWPDALGLRSIVVTLALLAGYIALMNPLGLPLASTLYVALATWHLKPARWVTAIVVGVITGVVSYTVFIQLLGLSFPAGFLFE